MGQSTHESNILLVHDGELSDVAAVLRELGAAATERRGGATAQDAERSWRLVLASARRALEIPSNLLRASGQRIAILAGESRTVCKLLRRASFEIVVRRPVHPAALRLLLLHALYRGPEKRRTPRVTVGAPVHVRAGLRRHPAILAEISERGCRLMTSQRVSVGQTLTLQIPAALATGRSFSVKGLVVRATPAQIASPGVITLEFDPLQGSLRERVRALVAAHSGGPSALSRDTTGAEIAIAELEPPAAQASPAVDAPTLAPGPPPATSLDPAPEVAPESAERASQEAQPASDIDIDFENEFATPARRLVPLNDEASRVVLARGLSRQGMRADPSLRLDRSVDLKLALHVDAGGPPILVSARVEPDAPTASDPAAAGPWLRFTDLADADEARLDALLAGLSIFAGGDGPEHALVVCEILDHPPG